MRVNEQYLVSTPVIDCESEVVLSFVEEHIRRACGRVEEAVALYYGVRDCIRYDPYRLELTAEGMKASMTIGKGYGWCVPKAVLLAACCRSRNIPARLGFGDVRNHLTTSRLRERMQTDVFYWHGYTEILLEGKWLKATPAFNLSLCEKFGIQPLEFDGSADSVLHPFDAAGNRHMEYIRDRGVFADLPLQEILATFRQHYGNLMAEPAGDFAREAEQEIGHG